MKKICTGRARPKWHTSENVKGLTPWALDMVLGIRFAYKWDIEPLKAVLLEFIWAGKRHTLAKGMSSMTLEHLKDAPSFATDLVGYLACKKWRDTAVWAPSRKTSGSMDSASMTSTCRRCGVRVSWETTEDAEGLIRDPFHLGPNFGWCRDCGKLDMIPWRN